MVNDAQYGCWERRRNEILGGSPEKAFQSLNAEHEDAHLK